MKGKATATGKKGTSVPDSIWIPKSPLAGSEVLSESRKVVEMAF